MAYAESLLPLHLSLGKDCDQGQHQAGSMRKEGVHAQDAGYGLKGPDVVTEALLMNAASCSCMCHTCTSNTLQARPTPTPSEPLYFG